MRIAITALAGLATFAAGIAVATLVSTSLPFGQEARTLFGFLLGIPVGPLALVVVLKTWDWAEGKGR